MRTKVLTKQCPSCNDCSIDEQNRFICSWGHSKEPKVMQQAKGRARICRLVVDKKTRKKYALH